MPLFYKMNREINKSTRYFLLQSGFFVLFFFLLFYFIHSQTLQPYYSYRIRRSFTRHLSSPHFSPLISRTSLGKYTTSIICKLYYIYIYNIYISIFFFFFILLSPCIQSHTRIHNCSSRTYFSPFYLLFYVYCSLR